MGVVPDIDDENIIPSPKITVYQPTEQEGWEGRLFVRAKEDPYALVPIVTGWVADQAGYSPAFVLCAVVCALPVFARCTMKRRSTTGKSNI